MKKSFKRWICCFLTVLMLVSTMMGSVTVSAASTLKKGSTFTSGQYKYKVTTLKGKTGEVALVGVTKKSVTSVKIPNTVTKGKYKFSVTSIADGALKGCTKLKTVTTNKNLKKIGKNAFSGCSKLVKLNIKSTKLTSVGKNALKGINKKAVIQVPKAKKTAYKKILKNKGQKSTVKVTVSGTTAVAPSTEAPETEAPKTEAPETEAPKTEAPTETPETEAPKTEAPTETPETEAPKTEAPTETPETEAPKPTTPPQADAPQQSGPSFDEPSFDEPQTSAPTPSPEPETKPTETEEPKTEAPTETPETEAPTEAAKPTTPPQADAPQQDGPSFDEPSFDEPQTSAPTPSPEPETKPAETEEPKTEAPTGTPETEAPTEAAKPTTPPQADAPQQDGPSADEPQTTAPTTPSTEPETKPTETIPNHTHANIPNALVRIPDTDPKCTEPGHKNCWKCTVCGEEFHSIKYHMSEESKPTGHKFTKSETNEATCTAEGSVVKICEKCGAREVQEVLPKKSHTWGKMEVIQEPNCKQYGIKAQKCTVCGAINEEGQEIVPADPKDPDYHVLKVADNIPATCTGWGKTNRKVCEVCGQEFFTAIKPTGHNFTETTVEATCTKDAYIIKKCDTCGETITEVIPGTKKGHSWSSGKEIIKEATCYQFGLKAYQCSECKETRNQEVIPKTSHIYEVNQEMSTPATCTKTGTKVSVCINAGCTESAEGHTKTEVIPVSDSGHSYTKTVEKEATCTSAGYKYTACEFCGAEESGTRETIPAKGHSFGDDNICTKCGYGKNYGNEQDKDYSGKIWFSTYETNLGGVIRSQLGLRGDVLTTVKAPEYEGYEFDHWEMYIGDGAKNMLPDEEQKQNPRTDSLKKCLLWSRDNKAYNFRFVAFYKPAQ